MKERTITEDNFLDLITVDPKADCWATNLPLSRDGRQQSYRFENKKARPVHIYWRLIKGSFPEGELWRTCGNTLCVNPDHYNLYSSDKDRFISKVSFDEYSGCWNWTASVDKHGYGHIRVDGNLVRTHRFSYEYYIGEIPDGYDVLHKCDNRKCCNPAHLFLGKDIDNALDRDMKGRGAGGKLSPGDIQEIRQLKSEGVSVTKILSKYPVSRKNIYRILNQQSWRWVE